MLIFPYGLYQIERERKEKADQISGSDKDMQIKHHCQCLTFKRIVFAFSFQALYVQDMCPCLNPHPDNLICDGDKAVCLTALAFLCHDVPEVDHIFNVQHWSLHTVTFL